MKCWSSPQRTLVCVFVCSAAPISRSGSVPAVREALRLPSRDQLVWISVAVAGENIGFLPQERLG